MRNQNLVVRARAWAVLAILVAPAIATATTLKKEVTLVDLLGQSELILHGTVRDVTDGIDARGIPYTEVTVRVAETLKGQAGNTYKFRQFGLLKPRSMGNGRVNLMVTPAAWASYTKGEETILFLHKSAAWTGLRTTAGLGQGKFQVSMAGATNRFNNAGLFDRVEVDATVLDDTESRVMATKKGAVNAKAFAKLVRHAVKDKWIEKGRMRNAQN